MAPLTTASSEALIRRFLPLADSIARRFAARWQRVIELDDAVQIARLTLVTKARRISNPATAPAFLKAHIHGALQHWLRDHSRLVHIPRRAQEASGYAFPFGHSSLDAPSASSGVSLLEAMAEVPVEEAEPSARSNSSPMRRAPRVGRPWAGCRVSARAALVVASDSLIAPPA